MGAVDGKVAVVTGAGAGLGRNHALLLASEGAKVVVNDIGDRAQDVVDEITKAGGDAVAHVGSASDWAASEALIRTAVDAFGDLDVLVNNAGFTRDKMSFNMDEADFDAVVDVHLKGHFCPSRHAGVYWREQSKAGSTKPRRIVNTTSEAGLFGSTGQANYSSAKAGIVALTWVPSRGSSPGSWPATGWAPTSSPPGPAPP
jgi:NAD(P)-dependent dehydrogenase (short-subunit alcohol dehydrogenase family)